MQNRIERDTHYQMYETLEAGMATDSKPARTLGTHLFKRWNRLWVLTQRAEVESMNNCEEQVL